MDSTRVVFDNIYEDVDLEFDCGEDQNGNSENIECKRPPQEPKSKLTENLILKIAFYIVLLLLVGVITGWIISASLSPNGAERSESTFNDGMQSRREFVKNMALSSWNAYSAFAWGNETLMPVTKKSNDGYFGNNSGRSILAAMSTLWIMDLKEEFEQGRQWIDEKLNLSNMGKEVVVFRVVTEYIGGLLSCYALTDDLKFVIKAKEMANKLSKVYETSTGI